MIQTEKNCCLGGIWIGAMVLNYIVRLLFLLIYNIRYRFVWLIFIFPFFICFTDVMWSSHSFFFICSRVRSTWQIQKSIFIFRWTDIHTFQELRHGWIVCFKFDTRQNYQNGWMEMILSYSRSYWSLEGWPFLIA